MTVTAENISKRYFRKTGGANHFYAVNALNLEIAGGGVTVLTGRSGSGKTTVLNILAGLLIPTEGKIRFGDTDLYSLDDRTLSRLRSEKIGVVPQGRSAVDTLTVMENILLPAKLYGRRLPEETACRWMDRLGIAQLRNARPAELSGGELRRMAIVRALSGSPDVILADEPTDDLDDENTKLALSALREAADSGKAVLLVTHEKEAFDYADHIYRMDAGTIRPAAGDPAAAPDRAEPQGEPG